MAVQGEPAYYRQTQGYTPAGLGPGSAVNPGTPAPFSPDTKIPNPGAPQIPGLDYGYTPPPTPGGHPYPPIPVPPDPNVFPVPPDPDTYPPLPFPPDPNVFPPNPLQPPPPPPVYPPTPGGYPYPPIPVPPDPGSGGVYPPTPTPGRRGRGSIGALSRSGQPRRKISRQHRCSKGSVKKSLPRSTLFVSSVSH